MKLDHHQRSAGERQSTLHLSVRAKVSRLENRAAAARKADLSSLATCVGVSSSLSSAALAVAARRRRPLAQAPLAPDSATFNCRPKTLTFGHAFSVAFELLRRANRGLRSDSGRRCCRSSVRPCVCVFVCGREKVRLAWVARWHHSLRSLGRNSKRRVTTRPRSFVCPPTSGSQTLFKRRRRREATTSNKLVAYCCRSALHSRGRPVKSSNFRSPTLWSP